MEIQERLLLEQIDELGNSMMGRMIMGDMIPTTVDEFRRMVPLTTYKDYRGYLDIQRDDVLPRKPVAWATHPAEAANINSNGCLTLKRCLTDWVKLLSLP